MNVVFDLDGTLINSKLRLYRLFQDLAPESQLSYDQYWSLKKTEISNTTILSDLLRYSKEAIARFSSQWMSLIESPSYLALDSNFTGIHQILASLNQEANLYVCTNRQHRERVLDQLDDLNLSHYFRQVLVTEKKWPKESLILSKIAGLNSKDWIIGDTGMDMRVGHILNLNTCAVLSGFRNSEVLSGYKPKLLIRSIVDLSVPLMLDLD